MNDTGDSTADKPANSFHTTWTKKSLRQHIGGVAKHWLAGGIAAVGLLGGLWLLVEVVNHFNQGAFSGWPYAATLVLVPVLGGFANAFIRYYQDCPPGFESESRAARHLAHLQSPRWECSLAQCLLMEKLDPLDAQLAEIIAGKSFTRVTFRPSSPEYIDWALSHFENIQRLLEVSKQLLIYDFPEALQQDFPERAQAILRSVVRIEQLYRDSIALELAVAQVSPADELTDVHALLRGWTSPIRGGVRQLHEFLTECLKLPLGEDSRISFTIVFDSMPNVDEYTDALDRVTRTMRLGDYE